MADEGKPKKKGLLGGNLFPKILALIAVGLVVSVFIFGIPLTIPDIFWALVRIVIAIGIIVLVIKGIEQVLPKTQFSPSNSFKDKMVRIAELSKPKRLGKLWMRGEDMRLRYYFGKITGLAFIPYVAGKPKTDSHSGKYVYVQKRDKEGNLSYDAEGNKIMVCDFANLDAKDGEWLMVVKRGMFSPKICVRADVSLCSDVMEEMYIKTVNLVPIGGWFYPHQQFQTDILRINAQHQAECFEETHMHYLDLMATVTESSLRSDPVFVKAMTATTENITSKDTNPMQSLSK